VGWTLNYEMFFYLIFSMSLQVAQAWRVAAVIAGLGCIVLYGALSHLDGIAGFYASAIILEFALGVVVGYSLTYRHVLPPLLAISVAAVVFASANYAAFPRLLAFGVPAAFLVYALTSYEKYHERLFQIGGLRILGDASYSLYLTHALTLAVLAKAWVHAGGSWTPLQIALFAGLALLSASLVGIAMYYCIEAPIHAFFRTYRMTNRARLEKTEA
jgi:exopolysaccharide production protein ExoZ